jgi:predicted nuclease with TOPRIM domain
MSISTQNSPESDGSTVTESNLIAVVEELQSRVATLESENDGLKDRVSTLESERDELQARAERLASENERLESRIEDVTEDVSDADSLAQRNSRKIAEDRGRISELEERVDELESVVMSPDDDTMTTPVDDFGDDFTRIEEINVISEYEDIEDEMGASTKRAVAMFRNWNEWSNTVPKGRVKRTADNLRQLLEAELDERIESKQVMRACRKLQELSDGKILLGEHKRHGKQLLQPKKYDFASLTESSS